MRTLPPTDKEMEVVMMLAKAMREKDKDKYGLGHALLYLLERNQQLEDVLTKADYYLRFGMGTKELTDLRLSIETARGEKHDAEESLLGG